MNGVHIPKGTQPRKCEGCTVAVYRVWQLSHSTGKWEPAYFDCEGSGTLRPRKLISGYGQKHVCESRESVA